MADLLNVDRALEQILDQIHLLPAEEINLSVALERVLAEDVHSQIDLPSRASSSMAITRVRFSLLMANLAACLASSLSVMFQASS